MKWKSWYPANVGDKRIETLFALCPIKIGNDCRWLETVNVEYEARLEVYDIYRKGRFIRKETEINWHKVRFVDNVHVQ